MTRRVLVAALLAVLPSVAAERWSRLTTTHFEMYSTSEDKTAREAIRYFERVREFFMQASPVKPPREFPTRIVAFKDAQEFHMYAPNQGVLAYFVPGPVRDSIVMEEPSPQSYPVTIHEYVHLVVRHSGLRIPLWLNEGWAEVYSTLKPVRDGVAVGDLIPRHMKWLDGNGWFSLSELAAINNQSPEYNESNRTGMFYAESWALAHMLYLSPDYKDNFGKFIGALNRGRSMDEALQGAFGRNEQQVFADLRNYLSRKKLYGTVFLTPFEKSDEIPVPGAVTQYDSDLMLADLHAAVGHIVQANRAFMQLQTDYPKRPEAFEAAGYLAIETKDKEVARKNFGTAFALGSNDPQLCMQLASLNREANQPLAAITEELERAVKLRPDFAEAAFQLGLLKVDAREFETAVSLLSRIGAVTPERMALFHSALAYASLQTGDLEAARRHVAEFGKAAKSPAETQGAERLQKLIDARSSGPAAVKPGEKLVRTEGTAIGMRCAAPASGTLSKMGISIDGRQLLFDVPEPAALEIARHPGSTAELKCGPLPQFRVIVEYAPAAGAGASVVASAPANAADIANQPAAGIIRRLEY